MFGRLRLNHNTGKFLHAGVPDLILAGLGNPERRYARTRHNAGFMFLSALGDRFGVTIKKKQFDAYTGVWREQGTALLLMAPLTYMNLSGISVHAAMRKYRLASDAIIVAHDDMDIATGRVKFDYDRSSAGHKGIESIIEKIGTKAFYRIRIGIGKPDSRDGTVDYVLSEFNERELAMLEGMFDTIADGLLMFIKGERQKAMEFVNRIKAA